MSCDKRKYGIFILLSDSEVSLNKLETSFFNKNILESDWGIKITETDKNKISLKKKYDFDTYLVIPNWNNPRWFVPLNKETIKKIGNIIKPTSLKASIVWEIAKLLNKINCIDIIFRDKIYLKTNSPEKLFLTPSGSSNIFAIYTGAKGIYQKFTVQEMDENNNIQSYYKIGNNEFTLKRLKNEGMALDLIHQYDFRSFLYPQLKYYKKKGSLTILKQSPSPTTYKNIIYDFGDLHKNALQEIFDKTNRNISKLKYLNHLYQTLENFTFPTNFIYIKNNLYKAYYLLNSSSKENDTININFSHGDFTPWNCFSNGDKLYIFDWEMAEERTSLWDYYNFIYHKNILLDSSRLDKLSKTAFKHDKWIKEMVGDEFSYKIIYLIEIILHYLDQYNNLKIRNIENNVFYLIGEFDKILKRTLYNQL